MRKIDPASWNRREIFTFFSGVSNPFYMVSFTVDVTELVLSCKAHHRSFYLSLIYLCTRAINSVENFRYTIRNGEIWLLDERIPSFTDLRKEEELFHITTAQLLPDLDDFVRSAGEKSRNQTRFLEYGSESDALIYFSCLPELRMTALTNERELLRPYAADSNIPSLSWGRYESRGNRIELTLSLEVNHRFIDGLHITRFVQRLEQLIRELD